MYQQMGLWVSVFLVFPVSLCARCVCVDIIKTRTRLSGLHYSSMYDAVYILCVFLDKTMTLLLILFIDYCQKSSNLRFSFIYQKVSFPWVHVCTFACICCVQVHGGIYYTSCPSEGLQPLQMLFHSPRHVPCYTASRGR